MPSEGFTKNDTIAIEQVATLLRRIVQALVDEPDSVQIETFTDHDETTLRLQVAPNDLGKVIGKQGRTARSIRTVLAATSMKLRHRFALDIMEPDRR